MSHFSFHSNTESVSKTPDSKKLAFTIDIDSPAVNPVVILTNKSSDIVDIARMVIREGQSVPYAVYWIFAFQPGEERRFSLKSDLPSCENGEVAIQWQVGEREQTQAIPLCEILPPLSERATEPARAEEPKKIEKAVLPTESVEIEKKEIEEKERDDSTFIPDENDDSLTSTDLCMEGKGDDASLQKGFSGPISFLQWCRMPAVQLISEELDNVRETAVTSIQEASVAQHVMEEERQSSAVLSFVQWTGLPDIKEVIGEL